MSCEDRYREAMGCKGVGEVKQGNHMAMCWEWEYKNMRPFLHVLCHCSLVKFVLRFGLHFGFHSSYSRWKTRGEGGPVNECKKTQLSLLNQ